MAPRLLSCLLGLAACATPPPPPVVNRQTPARIPFDRGMAFAPAHHTGVLAAHALPTSPLLDTIAPDPYAPTPEMCANANAMTGDGAAVGCDDPAEPRVYDLDGDGVADLALIAHKSYLGGGDRVYVRVASTLVRAFETDADLADEREDAGGIALRFEHPAAALRSSFTIHYDAIEHRWDAPIATVHATAGEVPVPQPPYRRFATTAPAELRPAPGAAALVTVPALAGGVIVSTAGAWSFVAVDPRTFWTATEGAWACGWISSAQIRQEPAR